ncbi:MAG: hypothetical protein C5B58_16010 [Acidobacteria bacterium]|nr:MAG: hypothetical protein C5B58_16010 [Acidobacteriota bacterium]
MRHFDLANGLHSVGLDADGHRERTTTFDWDQVDREVFGVQDKEDCITMADASACLALICQWLTLSLSDRSRSITSSKHPSPIVSAGMRAFCLLYMLDPVHCRYGSLQQIADACGLSKASCSKALVDLRRQLGGIMPFRRSMSSERYQHAQLAAVRDRVHASNVVRQRKQLETTES